MPARSKQSDSAHNALILKAIAGGGLSFAIQQIHKIENISNILYAESLARVTDTEGVVHTASSFVPQLHDGFNLDLRILDMVLSALAADTTLILGCNLTAANLRLGSIRRYLRPNHPSSRAVIAARRRNYRNASACRRGHRALEDDPRARLPHRDR